MRIVHRYVLKSFLLALFASMLVITFVMSIQVLITAGEFVARGVAPDIVLKIFLYGMPYGMMFSIPISVLVASLLVFGRFSSDGEIMAMKACGISLRQVATGPLAVSLAMTGVCLYFNGFLAPRAHFLSRTLKAEFRNVSPASLIEEGRFVRFDSWDIRVERKVGDKIEDIIIIDHGGPDPRKILSKSGAIHVDGDDMTLELFSWKMLPDKRGRGAADGGYTRLTIRNATSAEVYRRRRKNMLPLELIDIYLGAHDYLEPAQSQAVRSEALVEFYKRISLALSCFSFALLGVPLGMRSARRHTSRGTAISFVLAFNFFAFIIVADTLRRSPGLFPHVIVWMPVVLSLILGYALMRKAE